MDGQGQADDEALSRMEWKIEQEKMKLERERIALERERLEAMRERVKAETELRIGQDGRMTIRVSSAALCSIICLLLGGIVGAFSMSLQHDQRRTARLQEVMQSLGAGAAVEQASIVLAPPTPDAGAMTNDVPAFAHAASPAPAAKPLQVKTVRPKGTDSGVSVIIVQ